MSNFLSQIRTGKNRLPPRVLIYGTPGIGKSTFAASSDTPVFVQTEDGLDEIDCARFPKADLFEEVVAQLTELATSEHNFATVAIDSADWLERLAWDKICRECGVENIEKAHGGFAKGYSFALNLWREITAILDRLRSDRGMVSILIAHAKIEKFEDPDSSPYDRYSPRLHKLANAYLTEWADAVLFATTKVRTTTEDKGFGKSRTTAKAIGKAGGDRILKVVGSPTCVAKNRYGLHDDLPLSWPAFVEAIS